jgi:hypothetical protein
MKKYLLFTLLTCMLSICRAEGAEFAELKWGTPLTEAIKHLESKGFTPSIDKTGDISFRGNLLGHRMDGFALLAGKRVAKVIVNIQTPDNKARETYVLLKETLTKKYGQPEISYEYFNKPYYEGDGYEEQAIKLGKGRFVTFWINTPVLEISEKLTVTISYEGPLWHQEAGRRRQARDSIF